jgi:5-methylcytosine-specific restriction protein B
VTIKAVEAVFFARYSISNWRSLYDRVSEAGGYTKDALQLGTDRGDVIANLFGLTRGAGQSKAIQYVWPTGQCSGTIRWSSDRWQLAWLAASKPAPWTVAPTAAGANSIVGNPSFDNPTDADAEHARIAGTNVGPWLLAVKLFGEDDRLHVRTYFENPQPGLEAKATSRLPRVIAQAIAELPTTDDSATLALPPVTTFLPRQPPRTPQLVKRIQDALEREPNVLLVGPPGTGKTVALEDLQAIYDDPTPTGTVFFDTSMWDDNWSVKGAATRSETLVFHPSYSYENFVAGLYPVSSGQAISLEAKPGPLLCLGHWVGKGERQALMVIDEFNRGPAAAIFGDCLSLLDKEKRSTPTSPGARITRPYFGQSMPVPDPYIETLGTPETISNEVRLPAGLHIVAAMNSTDRSVAPLDAAMRRRFTVIRVGPDYDALAAHLGLDTSQSLPALPADPDPTNWSDQQVSSLAVQVLKSLNNRIQYCLGEDFLLGHALVWGLAGTTAVEKLSRLANAVDAKVVPTLRMTFIDQDEVLAAVLGVPDSLQVSHGGPAPAGAVAYWRTAPAALAQIAPKRLFVQSLHAMANTAQLAALVALSPV